MKAKNLNEFCTSEAPKEWTKLQEVKEAKPDGFNWILFKLDGLNICTWMRMLPSGGYSHSKNYIHITGIRKLKNNT